jgi:hypothetical protein
MGWGRMLLLGNVGQQLDIGDLNSAIGEMQSAFLENQQIDLKQARGIEQLRKENRELKLYLATLMRLLVSKGVLRQEEVETAVKAIETEN